MGVTTVRVKVTKTRQAKRRRMVEFRVDSGAVYFVVTGRVLRSPGCTTCRAKDFCPAGGSEVTRRTGDACFEYAGAGGPAPVAFGEKNDRCALGVTTPDALGLAFDRVNREPRPMKAPSMGATPARRAAAA